MTASEYRILRGLASKWWREGRNVKAADELDAALNGIEARADGPDMLEADVYGGTVPELRQAALAAGYALYGDDADLAVVHVGKVSTSPAARRGRFTARVLVRCLNFPREDS